ncbi:LLM class flavin-dependent oxidoreductase [Nannocystis bainbridge]|uniref:LLM class flavin-dependent oxidoreductase n=1 Tax=Nannocystis bainbridge TaxID=2995303 RepID=A0ABT5DP77_9BACT|nr:LLM class flavin-dependent oxidoreductase [Nannocystis bainbridge]MDC0715403.1 LLM class flavin-dependent oxidoreductase [Nannocystis bainbridge]
MRFGYWLPVFGGWLRNVPDEGMAATWDYARRLAVRSEQLGYDLTLVAELFLNDIKGPAAPALDAWTTAAALAAVTTRLELMVAVRPTFHSPAIFAKQAANLDQISGGRLALNVVSSWWSDEARRYGVRFERHDDRYARTDEWLRIVTGAWSEPEFSFRGQFYEVEGCVLAPKPARRPVLYAGGESEAAKTLIARACDAYVMHGDPPERVAPKVADMRRRREALGLPPMSFGMAAYVIVRASEAEAESERARITDVSEGSPGYANYRDFLQNTQLDQQVSREDYSVSNRGLRAGLVGTPAQVAEQIRRFEAAGVDLLLLQCSPQLEEMERFAAEVMPLLR